MPFAEPVHEVTQRAAPDDVVFVSYADNHSIVLAHVRALLTGPPGTIVALQVSSDASYRRVLDLVAELMAEGCR